ncbi:hypothetical protein PAPHI01_2300 [Pancytospora philotis]|nr:hypothetical protein PAPHI01_2300 [Pancytospora philotis]
MVPVALLAYCMYCVAAAGSPSQTCDTSTDTPERCSPITDDDAAPHQRQLNLPIRVGPFHYGSGVPAFKITQKVQFVSGLYKDAADTLAFCCGMVKRSIAELKEFSLHHKFGYFLHLYRCYRGPNAELPDLALCPMDYTRMSAWGKFDDSFSALCDSFFGCFKGNISLLYKQCAAASVAILRFGGAKCYRYQHYNRKLQAHWQDLEQTLNTDSMQSYPVHMKNFIDRTGEEFRKLLGAVNLCSAALMQSCPSEGFSLGAEYYYAVSRDFKNVGKLLEAYMMAVYIVQREICRLTEHYKGLDAAYHAAMKDAIDKKRPQSLKGFAELSFARTAIDVKFEDINRLAASAYKQLTVIEDRLVEAESRFNPRPEWYMAPEPRQDTKSKSSQDPANAHASF